jgi:hypothetical protein
MTSELKKAFLLLQSVIFQYHGFSEDERDILNNLAEQIDGKNELEWANNFVEENLYDAFERARNYLRENLGQVDNDTKIQFLKAAWDANNAKGFISEIEATALLKVSKDWQVERVFLQEIRKK